MYMHIPVHLFFKYNDTGLAVYEQDLSSAKRGHIYTCKHLQTDFTRLYFKQKFV